MDLVKKIEKYGKTRQQEKLELLLAQTSMNEILETVKNNIRNDDAVNLWNYILNGYNNNLQKSSELTKILLVALNEMQNVEIAQKHCFDIIIRMFMELPKLNEYQLIELTEFCIDSIRLGDPKFIGWKDLLPEVLKLLMHKSVITVNGIPMTGQEYRDLTVRQICTMRWVHTSLTPITMMFKDISLSKDDKFTILGKVCDNFHKFQPTELPPLAYQLFRLCNTAALVTVPIYGLNKYFQKHYYNKMLAEMDSDQTDYDSIDEFSPKEMQEAQETILYHLSKATEFKIEERDIVNFCKTIAASQQSILSPFFMCALLSMSSINRYPESVLLSSSQIVPFLRSIIQSNEAEKDIRDRSAWASDILDRNNVDLAKVLEMLIEQSKDGMEIVTPGLVWLSFAMLKSPSTSMHHLAMVFLEKFIKKRFIFGAGIVKNLVDFLLADLEAVQYADCLTRLSLTNTYTVSECIDTIQRVLDYLLLVPGAHAMRMMSFIIPLCKSSQKIRDLFIEMLRKAMMGRDSSTRQMGVYGFCLVLKHLRENNARRATSAISQHRTQLGKAHTNLVFSQQSISGYSLMSQTMLDTELNPQRHFDMLSLEIIGILRRCFNQTYEVKEVMYEGLSRAIDFNPKLTPHIIQFLEWHFQKYVVADESSFELRILDVVRDVNGTISVWDHLGHLTQLMGHCVIVCKQKRLIHDTRSVVNALDIMTKRIDSVTVEQLGLNVQMDLKMFHIGSQYLNCLEALMGYALATLTPENSSNVNTILKLFKHHSETLELLKTAAVPKKVKKDVTTATQSDPSKRITFNPVNIWNIVMLERFLQITQETEVSFATADQLDPLRKNSEFKRYVLRVVLAKMQWLPIHAEARHIKHSQSTFTQLGSITRIIFDKCLTKLDAMCERFDLQSAQLTVECFQQCLRVAFDLYPRKINFFLQTLTLEPSSSSIGKNVRIVLAVLRKSIDLCLTDKINDDQDTLPRIPRILLQCIELLLNHLPAEDPYSIDMFEWLFKICVDHDLDAKPMALIHKLLFTQRLRTNIGSFFDSIAHQIEQLVSDEEFTVSPKFILKSITEKSVDACIMHLCVALQTQIIDVEYFITRVKSLLAKIPIVGQSSTDSCVQSIKATEQKISSQLVMLAQTLVPLTNIGIPSGPCSDAVVKSLIQFYVCIGNLTKHLISRHASIPVEYSGIRFDKLIRAAGRPLASRIYDLIEHIENSVFADEKYTNNPAADKAKVLRATRLLPKLILRIENFNKFVHILGKKTKNDLSGHLHIGTVRDFKIRKSAFRETIDRVIAESQRQPTADDESALNEETWADSEEDNTELAVRVEQQLSTSDVAASSGCTASGLLIEQNNVDMTRPDVALKNMAIMNARLKRKQKNKPPQPVKEPACRAEDVYPPAKKKKKRAAPVENKSSNVTTTRRSTRSNSTLTN